MLIIAIKWLLTNYYPNITSQMINKYQDFIYITW